MNEETTLWVPFRKGHMHSAEDIVPAGKQEETIAVRFPFDDLKYLLELQEAIKALAAGKLEDQEEVA